MKRQGVILAGGTATRLGPLTKVLNKHLLPVGDKPMILHGLELMRNLGVSDLVIILGGNSVGDIVNLIQDGSEWGLNVTYKYQSKPSGISDAIYLAKDSLRPDKFLVLLGDNVFGNIPWIEDWFEPANDNTALTVSVKVPNPAEYGQAVLDKDGNVTKFVEKIKQDHDFIITGLYGFDYDVFGVIRRQGYSRRGEKEVVDTLNSYLPNIYNLPYGGYWVDCGTHSGLLSANTYYLKREEDDR